jgi:glycine/D-amino acid oxidase-like deaminating enzyme
MWQVVMQIARSSAVVEGTASGTILIGASRERVGFKNDLDVSILRQLARQAISLFPVLENIQLLRAYRGCSAIRARMTVCR